MHAQSLLPLESVATPHGLRRWPPHLRLAAGLLTVVTIVALPAAAYGAQAMCLGLLLVAGWGHGVRTRVMLRRLAPILSAGMLMLALMALLAPGGLLAGGGFAGPIAQLPPRPARLALWALLSKTGLAVLTLTVLTGLLSRGELLVAMRRLRVPRTVRVVSYLALHWLLEISEQAQSLRRAAALRGQAQGYRRVRLALSLGRALMLRCVRRADTLAFALCARGFTGDLPVLDSSLVVPGAVWAFAGYCLLLGALLGVTWWL